MLFLRRFATKLHRLPLKGSKMNILQPSLRYGFCTSDMSHQSNSKSYSQIQENLQKYQNNPLSPQSMEKLIAIQQFTDGIELLIQKDFKRALE